MCQCDPNVRTMYCGKPGCEVPEQVTGDKIDSPVNLPLIKLPAEEIAFGHCVIVNEVERPWGKQVAVVVEPGDPVKAVYLCTELHKQGWSRRISNRLVNVTPVGHFGCDVWTDGIRYWVEENGQKSRARYFGSRHVGAPDAKLIRAWQEAHAVRYTAAPHILNLCMQAIDGVASRQVPSAETWPIRDVLAKLSEAAGILLNELDYDGQGYEEIVACRQRAEQYLGKPEKGGGF